MLSDIRAAFAFLTIMPIGYREGRKPGYVFTWFPLIGLFIGLILAGIAVMAPLDLRAYLIVIAWVILTGGLHLDGFGDTCDGVLATATPERRLEIMKDPRAGTWAVVGLFLVLAGKLMLVAQIDPLLLVAAPIAGRWAMVSSAQMFPYARSGGLGSYFREGLGQQQWVVAALLSIAAAATIALVQPLAWIAIIIAILVPLLIGRWIAQRLGGGLTGDCYGAVCELTEVLCLVVWAWVI
jgi:adenosylcobinamide-GDP ribazoletransferase